MVSLQWLICAPQHSPERLVFHGSENTTGITHRPRCQHHGAAIIAAYEQSKQYKGITRNISVPRPVKLSRQQKHVVTLMARGYKNADIMEMTGLTIHTIKSHPAAAYRKLEVNNAMDAVLRAKELGLVE